MNARADACHADPATDPRARFPLAQRARYRRRRFMPRRLRLLWLTPSPSLRGVTAAREHACAPPAAIAHRHPLAHLPSYALARAVRFARGVRDGAAAP
jgi:hypothetical protein